MTVVNPNVDRYLGNYFVISSTIVDEDNGGTPLNITGMTVKWALSKGSLSSYGKTPVLEKKSTTAGQINIINAVGGQIEVIVRTTDTESFSTGSYYWELEITDTTNERSVVAVGTITFKRNVSNT